MSEKIMSCRVCGSTKYLVIDVLNLRLSKPRDIPCLRCTKCMGTARSDIVNYITSEYQEHITGKGLKTYDEAVFALLKEVN